MLDAIDKQLLDLLQEDCKRTHKALSLQLHLSPTAVHERIKKLERAGFIAGYVALVNKHKVARDFIVLCHVRLLQHSKSYLIGFQQEITALEEVVECLHVSGEYDYILKVCVKDMAAYREFLVTKLTTLNHLSLIHI